MTASPDNKQLAKYLMATLAVPCQVTRYWDDGRTAHVDVLRAAGSPAAGVTTHATLGLSDAVPMRTAAGAPLGAEVLMAARDAFAAVPNVLATCAFNVMKSGRRCAPGIVHPDAVRLYRPAAALAHVLFVPPFLWPLATQTFPAKTVAWLLAVPISDGELAYARGRGAAALERAFEDRQIDVFDLDRRPVF